jgi:hypothetical protein
VNTCKINILLIERRWRCKAKCFVFTNLCHIINILYFIFSKAQYSLTVVLLFKTFFKNTKLTPNFHFLL